MADEYRDKLKQTVDTSKWKIRWVPSQNPGRKNNCSILQDTVLRCVCNESAPKRRMCAQT